MNADEAKFLLRARRPGGRDVADPLFAEALAEAERDPKLRAWHEGEERFDAAVAGKLGEIAPPAGLREAILAGANATARSRKVWWRAPGWLTAAAAVAVMLAMAGRFIFSERGPQLDELAVLAMQDLAHAHDDHVGHPPELASVQTHLASVATPLRGNLKVDLDELRRSRCRSVRIAGHEVFEVCFQREGVWFHLYATRGGTRARGEAIVRELGAGADRVAVAAWSDAKYSYALVTGAGPAVLRRLL